MFPKYLLHKLRFYPRLVKAIWAKHQKLIILGFLVGAASFWLLPQLAKTVFKSTTQRIGLVGKFTTEQLPLEVGRLIGQGLTSVTEDGQVQPQLAESWTVSDNGREYLFDLRRDLTWHDGKPLLAKNISYHFSDVAASPIGDYQIKFILKEAFSPFPSIVSQPVFKGGLVGTGDYRVQHLLKNGQIAEKISLVPAKNKTLPKIIFRFYPTEQAAKTAFKLGEINVIKNISEPGELKDWPGLKIKQTVKLNRFAAIFFNTQNPKLAEKSARQALAYAIQKNWSNRAFGPLNPNSWAFNPDVKKYQYDLKNAQSLMTDQKEILTEIELATIPSLFPVAEAIKQDWEQLGIATKIKAINALDQDFEALLIIQEVAVDPDQYAFWHSTQKSNISQYKSFKVDNLLEEGRKETDLKKRQEIYTDIQRFIVEDTPAIFLFHPTLYTVSRQ
ncbi:hypothetical protein COT66_00035 [Candidatus Shapirobacteria bacterium CG09_land_8_20_14_0_10_49_15]|uniref:Solute-binding protein family 5 domain-containing protein n=1 Tax=Candidatus Shapirobacteria bacterium CG09_land_8_20_14_0_10_49_15 TaxID=1974482 RepID=A0A2M6XBN3_9BACT|nr:MAG: hypothetical protein COT66_00035 [Candidatus Shapirobacteria bacterium CG09_land_8_20_14_0_10_49_15]